MKKAKTALGYVAATLIIGGVLYFAFPPLFHWLFDKEVSVAAEEIADKVDDLARKAPGVAKKVLPPVETEVSLKKGEKSDWYVSGYTCTLRVPDYGIVRVKHLDGTVTEYRDYLVVSESRSAFQKKVDDEWTEHEYGPGCYGDNMLAMQFEAAGIGTSTFKVTYPEGTVIQKEEPASPSVPAAATASSSK